jgi:hypothetical protein
MNPPEDRLRDALRVEAERVDVAPGALDDIRRRISTRRRRSWRLAALAVPALATAAAVAVGLATCAPQRPDAVPRPADSASAAVSAAPSPSASPPVSPDQVAGPGPSTGAGRSVPIPVYYVGQAPRGPVLYREFRPAGPGSDTPAGRVRAAVALMLTAGSAADPDYATYWPAGIAVRDARVDGGTVTVDLTGVTDAAPGDPERTARSVDQLVYTATAASDTDLLRVLVDGRTVPALWGVPVGAALGRRPAVDVQAPLWLIEPAQGATVGGAVPVHVAGIVFEATARLRVRDARGVVVADRTLTLSAGPPQVGEVRVSVTLPPGRYTFEVFAVSAADGSEQFRDDHQVTVG